MDDLDDKLGIKLYQTKSEISEKRCEKILPQCREEWTKALR